jgi:flagellar secretion chaperone FliS
MQTSMQSSARQEYLATQVTTAAPQKLQLMLLEAAIRSTRKAKEQWQAGRDDQACESLIHAQEVAGQLLAALDREANSELVSRVAAVYAFIYRCLVEANCHRDEKKLDDALRTLEIERETWYQLCLQLGSQAAAEGTHGGLPVVQSHALPSPHRTMPLWPETALDISPSPGLSLEA